MFDYSYIPQRHEVVVELAQEPRGPYGVEVRTALDQQARRHGFEFVERDPQCLDETSDRPTVLRHLIYCAAGGFSAELIKRLAPLLEHRYSSISLAFSYASVEAMLRSEPAVAEAKAAWGDRLNMLRPDEEEPGPVRVSIQKIADNAVCDTIRVKYRPRHQSVVAPAMSESIARYFERASELYGRHRLYHRAPMDGYIAARAHQGFFITATKTTKIDLDRQRISFVHRYDEASNTLDYDGRFLPSSDAVEAAIVFAAHPRVDYLFHTHASRLFTRNPRCRHLIDVPKLPYGEPALGHALAGTLGRGPMDLSIMEDHGEVFFGVDEGPEQFSAKVDGYCDRMAATLAAVAAPTERPRPQSAHATPVASA